MVFKWHKAFKEGWENAEDDPRSGRPISSTNDQNLEEVRAAMTKDRILSVRMIAEETELDKHPVHRIEDNLHMWKFCAKLVPKNKKANRLENCHDMLGRLEIGPIFLDKLITGNESWVFEYEPNTKRQSEKWHTKSSPRPKKARTSRYRGDNYYCFSIAVQLCTKNLYLQDRLLITPCTKMSSNDFENRSRESEGTLQTIGCCTTVTRQFTLRFQFEKFWQRKIFPYSQILPTSQI